MPVWPEIVFSQDWMTRLERMAERRFPDVITAEESVTYVIEQLSADDWARCHAFTGGSKPDTFLYSVSSNLIEEFARRRYGRVRPPEWLKQEGELWVQIWRSLCLEREHQQRITDRLCADGAREAGLISNIMRAIKAKLPWCGASSLPIPAEYQNDSGESVNIVDQVASSPAPLQAMTDDLREDVLASLSALAGSELPAALRSQERLSRLRERLALEEDELLLLKLHFQEGLSGQAIARLLGVPNHQPGRQIRKLLNKIRDVFDAEGVSLALMEPSTGGQA